MDNKHTDNLIIRVYGIVQGVGFRPFISRTADRFDIKGSVANKGSYVEIFAAGDKESLGHFVDEIKHNPPVRSNILKIDVAEDEKREFDSFEIIESEKDVGDIFVSPDIAICEKCKKELYDPKNRRYMHPFINCTNCGPRLTILEAMPYDRERTSMKEFKMCPQCEYEYTHAETRRYDAQPVCCNDCGPEVYLISPEGTLELTGHEAITAARRALTEGKIVAIKGIGGFHLACDAKNEEAVARLRMLKNRPMKPFAVMMKDMDTVKRECIISVEQSGNESGADSEITDYLTGYQKPIILLEKRNSPGKKTEEGHQTTLADSVAPDNPKVGVMLPYTPLHMLIFDYTDEYEVSDCLVMTSANASGAPICRTDEDALNEISGFTDYILSNNRMIRTRADDSVMDFYKGEPYMIRRSRGFAPLPVMIDTDTEAGNKRDYKGCVLAVGGELKNTFAIAKDSLIYPSAYVGDMEDIRTVNALEESITRMETLLEAEPSLVVCDLHPKYNTTEVAEGLGLPVLKIQHHYAHILSCMAENDYLDEVIGVSFDGTGYGTDGTIWGGEFLKCSPYGFERLEHIDPFMQCGGDLSSKEGWRIAASILGDFAGDKVGNKAGNSTGNNLGKEGSSFNKDDIIHGLGLCSEMEYVILSNMAKTGVNSIMSTSAGRLFDAVSAVLGIRRSSTFEGEAATSLMFAAERYLKEKYSGNPGEALKAYQEMDSATSFGTNSLVKYIANEKLRGESSEKLAMTFHLKLAQIISETILRLCEKTGIITAALSGGVFQNTLLLELVEDLLKRENIHVLRHSLIPPNDGGICVGQALAGLAYKNIT